MTTFRINVFPGATHLVGVRVEPGLGQVVTLPLDGTDLELLAQARRLASKRPLRPPVRNRLADAADVKEARERLAAPGGPNVGLDDLKRELGWT